MEMDKKTMCPIVDVDGVLAAGKQFDLEITLPKDDREVIYGVIKDCYGMPIADAVVKLIEIDCRHGKRERKPVSHTFTDCEGEFVFGPLCPGKDYEIQVWADRVRHIKGCAKCNHTGRCLKGVDMDKCDCYIETTDKCKKHDDKCKKYDDKCKKHDDEKDYDKKDHDKKDYDKKDYDYEEKEDMKYFEE